MPHRSQRRSTARSRESAQLLTTSPWQNPNGWQPALSSTQAVFPFPPAPWHQSKHIRRASYRGLVQSVFSPPSRPPTFVYLISAFYGRAAGLKTLCIMGSNSLWGVERGNRRKSNHSKPLFLPIKNLGLPRRAAPVGRVDPDRMPQMIRSRLVVKVAHEARPCVIGM